MASSTLLEPLLSKRNVRKEVQRREGGKAEDVKNPLFYCDQGDESTKWKYQKYKPEERSEKSFWRRQLLLGLGNQGHRLLFVISHRFVISKLTRISTSEKVSTLAEKSIICRRGRRSSASHSSLTPTLWLGRTRASLSGESQKQKQNLENDFNSDTSYE